jgi:small GTP-binding protein
MSYNYLFRFILVGDSGIVFDNSAVGKSSMLLRYEQSNFKLQYQATIGIEYSSKLIDIGQPIKLEVWDTSGQEVFRSVARSYYRNCSGVVLVYDISNKKSF